MSIDTEKEYDNRGLVPEFPELFAKRDAASAAYRAASPQAELGIKYGPSARQYIDFFPAGNDAAAPLALFIHGGYWRYQEPTSFSHLAASLNARGVSVGIVGYDLCPQVSIATIIDEIRAACLFMWKRRQQRMLVFGHSAGGHLTACMVATDFKTLDANSSKDRAPSDLVPAGYSLSAVSDLTPLVNLSVNADLRLDAAEAKHVSPLFWPVPPGRTLDVVVGGAESGEFRRQSRILADGWQDKAKTRYEEIPGANHFTVTDPLDDKDSAMSVRLAELAKMVAKAPL